MKKDAKKMELFLGQYSHVGYDCLVNEDDYGWFSTPVGDLLVVTGGFRGQAGGGVVSRLATAAFQEYLTSLGGEGAAPPSAARDEILKGALLAADLAVQEAQDKFPELRGLGASLVALLISSGQAFYIHVGLSRLYLLSGQGLKRLTRDHCLACDLVDTGRLTEEQAAVSPERHRLTMAVGSGLKYERLDAGRLDFQVGDTFLLCASGLSDLIDDAAIEEVLKQPFSPQDRARNLIEAAVNVDGADNLTVQVLSFKPGQEMGPPPPLPGSGGWRWRSFFWGFIFGFGACWGGLYAWQTWGHLLK